MILLRHLTSIQEAHMARGMLSSHDIEVFLHDALTAGSLIELNISSGGVRLMVREEDFARADALMKDVEAK